MSSDCCTFLPYCASFFAYISFLCPFFLMNSFSLMRSPSLVTVFLPSSLFHLFIFIFSFIATLYLLNCTYLIGLCYSHLLYFKLHSTTGQLRLIKMRSNNSRIPSRDPGYFNAAFHCRIEVSSQLCT